MPSWRLPNTKAKSARLDLPGGADNLITCANYIPVIGNECNLMRCYIDMWKDCRRSLSLPEAIFYYLH